MADNIEVIKWAFKKGYQLGNVDMREGVHINYSETQKYFLKELTAYLESKNMDINNSAPSDRVINIAAAVNNRVLKQTQLR